MLQSRHLYSVLLFVRESQIAVQIFVNKVVVSFRARISIEAFFPETRSPITVPNKPDHSSSWVLDCRDKQLTEGRKVTPTCVVFCFCPLPHSDSLTKVWLTLDAPSCTSYFHKNCVRGSGKEVQKNVLKGTQLKSKYWEGKKKKSLSIILTLNGEKNPVV